MTLQTLPPVPKPILVTRITYISHTITVKPQHNYSEKLGEESYLEKYGKVHKLKLSPNLGASPLSISQESMLKNAYADLT